MKIKFVESAAVPNVLFSRDLDHVADHFYKALGSCRKDVQQLVVIDLEKQAKFVLTRPFGDEDSGYETVILVKFQ
jgi:hypothetical protein